MVGIISFDIFNRFFQSNPTGYTKTFSDKSTQTAVYTYNDLGAVASIECTGVEPSVTTYEYNNHGDVIKESVTVEGVETVTTYEYTYQQ